MGLFAVVILGALIFFHELGHFLVAKLCKVGVIEFAVGFGPKIVSWISGNTQYSLRAIPLGGYVKMAGESAESIEESEKDATIELLPHEQYLLSQPNGWFINKPLYKRAAVVFAGPLFNLIFAYGLAIAVLVAYGVSVPTDTTIIGEVMENYPAQAAGVMVGDQVTGINDVAITDWSQIRDQVAKAETGSVTMKVNRSGEEKSFVLKSKEISPDVDYLVGSGEGKKGFMIGITQETKRIQVGIGQSFAEAGIYVGYLSWMNLKSIYGLLKGLISPQNLGGPISIIKEAAKSARNGLERTFNFMIFLNIGLAVLNLLPIPVLDGGHLLFFLIEAVRGRPLGLKAQEYATRFGMSALLLLMVYALTNDVRGLHLF